jgi:hypothetical protein
MFLKSLKVVIFSTYLLFQSQVFADTTPPGQIQNLQVNHLSQDMVLLAWDERPAEEQPRGGYTIYRDGEPIASEYPEFIYRDTSVIPGRSYTYQISVSDAAGNESRLSNPYTVVVPDTTRPTQISGLALSYAELDAVRIYWNEPPHDEGPFSGYTIYRNGAVIESGYDSFIYTDNTVIPGTLYRYQVTVTDRTGNESPLSDRLAVTIPGTSICGDGIVNDNEECDLNEGINENQICDANCRIVELQDPTPETDPVPDPVEDPSPITPPINGIIWMDDFNYIVRRSASGTSQIDNAFVRNGPWTSAKSEEFDQGARAYIYTVDPTTDIPGNSINPSATSDRVLAMEALIHSMADQSDFYLAREVHGQDNQVLPADSWVQFWYYTPRSGDQMSGFLPGKLLYPCRGRHGSCTDFGWLIGLKAYSTNPVCHSLPDFVTGQYILGNTGPLVYDNVSLVTTCPGEDEASEIGTGSADDYIRPNTWYLVKFHMDTSTPTPSLEMWLREYGSDVWTKPLDWVSGVTPGFTWTIPENRQRGHDYFRLVTTLGYDASNPRVSENLDTWMYFADFVVATSEDALPNYTDDNN